VLNKFHLIFLFAFIFINSDIFYAALPLQSTQNKCTGNDVQLTNGPVSNIYFRYAISLTGRANHFPLINNNRIFIGTDQGILYCIDLNTGIISWQVKIGNNILTPPYITGDFLYIANAENNIFKISSNFGNVIWSTRFQTKVQSCIGISNDFIFCLAHDGHIYKVNAKTGFIVSSYKTNQKPSAYAVAEGNILYSPGENNNLMAFDIKDIRLRYSVESETDLISPPLICSDKVIITGRNKIYAIDKVRGRIVWIRRLNLRWFYDSVPVPKRYKDLIFLGERGFDYNDGSGKWLIYARGLRLTDTYIAGNYLYYGGSLETSSNKGFINIFNIDNKKITFHLVIKEIPHYRMIIHQKMILFYTQDNKFVAYSGT